MEPTSGLTKLDVPEGPQRSGLFLFAPQEGQAQAEKRALAGLQAAVSLAKRWPYLFSGANIPKLNHMIENPEIRDLMFFVSNVLIAWLFYRIGQRNGREENKRVIKLQELQLRQAEASQDGKVRVKRNEKGESEALIHEVTITDSLQISCSFIGGSTTPADNGAPSEGIEPSIAPQDGTLKTPEKSE